MPRSGRAAVALRELRKRVDRQATRLLVVQSSSEPGSGAHFRSHTKAEAGQQRAMREARRQRQRRPSREVMLSYSTKQ
jgi:hypothetical protein